MKKSIIIFFALIIALAIGYFGFLNKDMGLAITEKLLTVEAEGRPKNATAKTSQESIKDVSLQTPQPPQDPQATDAGGAQEFWTKRCNEKGDNYCEIFQRLVVKENNQRLIEFAIGYPEKNKDAQAAIILPLGVSVSKGVTLTLEGRNPSPAIPIKTCMPDGCVVIMQLDKLFMTQMAESKAIMVGFFDVQDKPMNVPLSLVGFPEKIKTIQ